MDLISSDRLNFGSISSPPIIAPFLDGDSIHIISSGPIYYRQENDESIATMLSTDLVIQFPDIELEFSRLPLSLVFVVTWYKAQSNSISYCNLTNTFQVVLMSNGLRTFVKFNYGDIQWGGSTTLIGVSAGDRLNFIMNPNSLSSDVYSLANSNLTYQVDRRLVPVTVSTSLISKSTSHMLLDLSPTPTVVTATISRSSPSFSAIKSVTSTIMRVTSTKNQSPITSIKGSITATDVISTMAPTLTSTGASLDTMTVTNIPSLLTTQSASVHVVTTSATLVPSMTPSDHSNSTSTVENFFEMNKWAFVSIFILVGLVSLLLLPGAVCGYIKISRPIYENLTT